MHRVLDEVWRSVDSRMKDHSMVCVNVGDATRTLGGSFSLYPNHARVGTSMLGLGYQELPEILWRKRSNKPNKFMGSGMLPPGAYVTQEHEYILLFRKGGKRGFTGLTERSNRTRSAFFWEERNSWFSDMWEDLKGERQRMTEGGPRSRSAAFPFELAYRLVSMFSVRDDMVADPFAGTGMTMLAAMAAGRNSVSFEVDPEFRGIIEARISTGLKAANDYVKARLRKHAKYAGGARVMKYRNQAHGFPVMTAQEVSLELPFISSVTKTGEDTFEVDYAETLARFD
jgi:DNA modification methylase